MIRFLRSAFVIARRDFSATVLSKAFIFFLLAPAFPLLLGGEFGSIGARVATQAERPVVAVIAPRAEFERLKGAREQLAGAVGDQSVLVLAGYSPERDLHAQERRLLVSEKPPVRAVLSGSLDNPRLLGTAGADEAMINQLRVLISSARAEDSRPAPAIGVTTVEGTTGSLSRDRADTALYGQMLLFFLTILLSGMVLSQLIEEKSNKVIEVIAAAIPIDAMFVGKLFAMLAASIVGIIVWISAGALFIQFFTSGGIRTLPMPAVGWPTFLGLAIIYFAMNYLLLGAAFLTIGAQAST
ncbi:MAG TPA: ABC transporter permease, partial [Sphingomicrobium sp.]|nr:ABC transporter permease [Sphingomicrobium sp.]